MLESGARAIVPGDPKASALVARINTHDPAEIMPPAKLNRPLTEAERDILIRWIGQGAVYEPHWAFVTPRKHEPPAVRNAGWCRDDIDRFVLGKIENANLAPNPEADRATLLRRASLTLTGLPPSPDQLQAFIADTSPTAYEKQIDAMLASPRYGERMAQDWLDVARFADTYGYQSDNACFVWPWRDWVIGAFNSNLSYDKFAGWQIAGDMLPDATRDQRLATTFNRLHRQTQEGGSIEAEFRQENVSDRVHTFGTAFLGLTMECAKCHDHKYDPLPQSDYYSMAAMFGQIDECGLYPFSLATSAPEPSMRLEQPQHGPEIAKRRAALADAAKQLADLPATREDAFVAWLAARPTVGVSPRVGHYPLDAASPLANLAPNGKPATVSGGKLKSIPGDAVEFDGDTLLHLDGVSGVTRHDPLTVAMKIRCPDVKDRAVILHSGPVLYSQAADASGFELLLEKGKMRWSCIHLWPGCAASIESKEPFPLGKWVQVTVTYDGSSRAAGLKMYFDGKPVATAVVTDQLDKNISAGGFLVGARPRDDRGFAHGQIDELSVFRDELVAVEVADLAGSPIASRIDAAISGDATAKSHLRDYYLRHVDPVMATARTAVLTASKNLHDNYLDKIPLIMVMRESPVPKQFHVLSRGDYASPDFTKPVQPSPPPAVMPFPADAPRNRLGLARWTTDPANPLVSRVAVNRFWMMCFGNGIVPTQENFGLQGDAPSHPELLDSLSHDFVATGWDVKMLLKRIVMSATFRQASNNTAEKLERDPLNRLLARGPSYRLSGEAIRDQALFAAGLLVEKVGGPSVKPWQPPGVWSEAGASGGDYVPDKGEGQYRRSLYTFRKRTAPPPALIILDAGSREICQARRLTTNTPLQPLIFLNDMGFFECARKLAERCVAGIPGDAAAQCERAFSILACRAPRPAERSAIHGLYQTANAAYAKDPAAARSVAGKEDPSLAALVVVCSTLLTSDTVITNR